MRADFYAGWKSGEKPDKQLAARHALAADLASEGRSTSDICEVRTPTLLRLLLFSTHFVFRGALLRFAVSIFLLRDAEQRPVPSATK